jgi:hypothetical protein
LGRLARTLRIRHDATLERIPAAFSGERRHASRSGRPCHLVSPEHPIAWIYSAVTLDEKTGKSIPYGKIFLFFNAFTRSGESDPGNTFTQKDSPETG